MYVLLQQIFSGVIVAPCTRVYVSLYLGLFVCLLGLYVPFYVTVLLFILANQFQEQNCKV